MGSSRVEWVPPESFDEYRLIKALGRGGMGQVWLAHDTVLDRLVAVKLITEPLDHDAVRRRFLTEARAAARVQHPNVVAVYRVGEIGPRPYLISEYVRGVGLDKIARPVAWPRLLELAIGLARGLAAAHRRGVLHRDLKPANAMVSETGEVKLLDFGLAKLLSHVALPPAELPPIHQAAETLPGDPTIAPPARDEPRALPLEQLAGAVELPAGAPARWPGALALSSVTRTGAMMGTPAYMPPEAWRGEPATPRSDVYSLGALLYELGAGAPPHRGSSPEAMREGAIAADATSLAIAAQGIDPGFAAIVDRCLRRDPAERFASGEAVREALEALAAGDAPSAKALARPPREGRSSRWRRTIFTGAALALAFTLAFLAHRTLGGEHPAVAASCPDGMVQVPAGTFRMGSPEGEGAPNEQPQREVTLSAYCIDRTEVTVAAYAACVAAKGCGEAPQTVHWNRYSVEHLKLYNRWCNREDRPEHPINCVDWEQAATYCRWKGQRLPTEAEWEYAARGSAGRAYPWGEEAPSARRMNACDSDCVAMSIRIRNRWPAMYEGSDGWETTAPAGSYPAGMSPSGALDMAGNVWEWTADWYGVYPAQAETNPQGPSTGTSRVSRGGGWVTQDANKSRTGFRRWETPMVRDCDLGFRCARGN